MNVFDMKCHHAKLLLWCCFCICGVIVYFLIENNDEFLFHGLVGNAMVDILRIKALPSAV